MKKEKLLLLLAMTWCSITKAQVTSYPFAQAMDTFQLINGTVVDSPNEDDAYHANLPIGFNFTYNGTTTDKFGVCTNGYIVMDSLNHPATWFLTSNSRKQVCVAARDLKNSNVGGSIEYVTAGTAPNRVLVVQWKDYGIFGLNYCHLNFQIRLFEGSNCIQFYYGSNGVSGSGQPFYVGLIGDTITDFNLRTTTNDWTNTSASGTYPGSGMHLGPFSTLPAGLVYAFGVCPSTGIQFSYFTGKIYNDANNNGQLDAGENGLGNVIVHENLQNYVVTTDTGGNYALFFVDSSLTYTITCTSYTYWNISSLPVSYTVNPATQAVNGLHFGLHATPNVHDVSITAWSSSLPWPNATVNFTATYHNKGTVTESDTVFFTKDAHYQFLSSVPAPSYNSGNDLYWLYSNLLPLEYRNISMQLKADTTIGQGDTLFSFWQINPFLTDTDQTNNRVDQVQACLSSFDPNEKNVAPEGTISNTGSLEYTVKFQNTGTASAQNVFIHDQLDAGLDVTTFEVKGYSHPMSYTINGTGHVIFTFAGISLPDSNSNEPGSHGFVRYAIKPKPGLADGTLIYNTAAIYFDFNPPVITNTTQNIIGNTSAGINGIATEEELFLYPNPAGDEISIRNEKGWISSMTITDISGRTLRTYSTLQQEMLRVDIRNLSRGLYFISVTAQDGSRRNASFVKN